MKNINCKGKVEALNKDSSRASLRSGFTLIEMLTTVLIIGILAAVALPMYTRTIERSRATEAMSSIKAINDAIYTFFIEREECPERFSQLVASLPDVSGEDDDGDSISTKFFQFDLGVETVRKVPGTDCPGVLATRINGGSYNYIIWHPYTRGTTGTSLSLQCAPVDANDNKSKAVCESLGLFRDSTVSGGEEPPANEGE